MGRTYNATTPVSEWKALSKHVQRDRITFASHGTFLRLYKNGSQHTSYGIHSHAYIGRILKETDRFASMGCVLVNEEVLPHIVKAYELNGNALRVTTVDGLIDIAQEADMDAA